MTHEGNIPDIGDTILGKIQSAGTAYNTRVQKEHEDREQQRQKALEATRRKEEYEIRAQAMGMEVVRLLRNQGIRPLPLIESRRISTEHGTQQKYFHTGEAWHLYTDIIEPNDSDELYETFRESIAITHLGRLCTKYKISVPPPTIVADLQGSGLRRKECLIDPDYDFFSLDHAPWNDAITTLESEHFQTKVAELLYRHQQSQ